MCLSMLPEIFMLAGWSVKLISSSDTDTVRVVGVQTGLTAIISVQVNADPGSSNPPDRPDDSNLSGGNGGVASYG